MSHHSKAAQQGIPSDLEAQIHLVTNHAINTVANQAAGKDKKQIFTELKEALAKVGVQPHDESVRQLARQIWRDTNLESPEKESQK